MLEVGLRVVRGQDWKWEDQDGGEGHAGTIVEIGKPPSMVGNSASSPNPTDRTPDKTVIIQWDHGARSNYRIGYQGAYDLLMFDNAAAGVKHSNIICDGCKRHGIIGIRWKCSQCFDYDLCTQCYMADVHELTHTFQRFQTANSVGIQLGPREGCTKISLKGIFIGAKVIRGPDWEWGDQDGGRGKTGRVMDIRGWDNESSRSVATVTWSTGSTNVYRLGYKGCVDLCYVEEATAGTYYKEHLPLLGQPVLTIPDNGNSSTPTKSGVSSSSSPHHLMFNVGDKVKVLIEVDILKEMQDGHGGWNPRMAEYIGKIGTVHRITDKGDIRVQYEGCNNRWTFHPGALTKVPAKGAFSLGDIVRVKSDLAAVKQYQIGHGEWTDIMKNALGKTGKIIKIYPDGDLRVALDGPTWTFNPLSVVPVPSGTNVMAAAHDNANRFKDRSVEGTDSEVEKLLRDAAKGEAGVASVREFLKKYPGKVDARAPGGGRKTCLQVAAHQGQRELCNLLLDAGASLRAIDEDGDTPLHYAAFGNQPEIMELLLSRGAAINAVNNGRCSALHVAVNKQHAQCVRVLLRHHCDVNLQDSYADTALHDAIGKDALDVIDALCACERVDFTLRNKRGFNVLHHAALKGNAQIENNPPSNYVEPSTYRIDNTSQLEELRGARKSVSGSGDAAECRDCSGIVTGTKQENRLDPSSSVTLGCARCGHTIVKTQMIQGTRLYQVFLTEERFISMYFIYYLCIICLDGQLATGEVSIANSEEKSKNVSSEGKRKEEISDREREKEKDKDLERLRYLETRVADLEEANMCSICMERRRNVAFLCGHGACEHCAAPLKTCHMCRKTITKKINLY
ncbi:hypothetical protein ACFW04_007392 [Cataglyphis niger]